MTKSGFAQLHHTLLHRVFSCVDKVRSEQVCTAWRAYLSGSSSQSSRDVWSDQLVVHLFPAAIRVRMVQLAEKVLSSPLSYLSSEQKSFVEWLVKRAALATGATELSLSCWHCFTVPRVVSEATALDESWSSTQAVALHHQAC